MMLKKCLIILPIIFANSAFSAIALYDQSVSRLVFTETYQGKTYFAGKEFCNNKTKILLPNELKKAKSVCESRKTNIYKIESFNKKFKESLVRTYITKLHFFGDSNQDFTTDELKFMKANFTNNGKVPSTLTPEEVRTLNNEINELKDEISRFSNKFPNQHTTVVIYKNELEKLKNKLKSDQLVRKLKATVGRVQYELIKVIEDKEMHHLGFNESGNGRILALSLREYKFWGRGSLIETAVWDY